MNVMQAIQLYKHYQTVTLKPVTNKSYDYVIRHLLEQYPDQEVEALTPVEISSFLDVLTEDQSKSSIHLRQPERGALGDHLKGHIVAQ